MPEIDFSKKIKTIKGKNVMELSDPSDETSKEVPMMLKTMAVNSLVAPPKDPKVRITGRQSVQRTKLAEMIESSKKPMELTIGQVSTIKKLIEDNYQKYPLMRARAIEILDPELYKKITVEDIEDPK